MKTQIFLMYIVTILLLTFQLFPDLFVRIKPLLLNETGDVMVNGKVTNKTDIIKIVWQTLRRSTYEILGVKLLMKGYIWYRFHCLQKKLWSKFCRKKYWRVPTKLSGESATYWRPKKCFSNKSRCLKTASSKVSPLECF